MFRDPRRSSSWLLLWHLRRGWENHLHPYGWPKGWQPLGPNRPISGATPLLGGQEDGGIRVGRAPPLPGAPTLRGGNPSSKSWPYLATTNSGEGPSKPAGFLAVPSLFLYLHFLHAVRLLHLSLVLWLLFVLDGEASLNRWHGMRGYRRRIVRSILDRKKFSWLGGLT